ncbi:ComF family protein [Schaalia hyovaginalis]|uniref:ComF family protein n=1 Tax=Schaalia hyovaginalis TaxID=29316 RepID=UPI0023F8EFA2|nr:competence protein ComF [Schaalia hyovaginalis]MCI7671087.1 competence protein ComF [Schaalia hyovaginalis]
MTATLLRAAQGLLWPTQCFGCGAWDEVVCPACAALARRPPVVGLLEDAPRAGESIPLIASGAYEGELRSILLAAKHSPAFDGSAFLEEAGFTLGRALAGIVALREGEDPRSGEPWWVVPAPPSWKRRLAGTRVTDVLARGVARGLACASGARVLVVDAIAVRIGAHSQAGRGGTARRRGREGIMRARVRLPDPGRIILVDDVITTGATLRELARVCAGARAGAVLAQAGAGRSR